MEFHEFMFGMYLVGVVTSIGIYIEFVFEDKDFKWYFIPIVLLSWVSVGKILALIALKLEQSK